MKPTYLSSFACAVAVLLAPPVLARADNTVNFNDTAKQILSEQPGLVEYVEARYDVKPTGIAKEPAGDDHPAVPPYIFRARPKGSHGPYNIKLLIQPGLPGHILGVLKESSSATAANEGSQTSTPTPPAPQIPALTADTPSGPITNGSTLTPPPDPAPTPH